MRLLRGTEHEIPAPFPRKLLDNFVPLQCQRGVVRGRAITFCLANLPRLTIDSSMGDEFQ